MENPLISESKLPFGAPQFDKIKTEHYLPAIKEGIAQAKANIITTPGAGFGPSGEGYIRLTAFGDADATVEAMERIKALQL